MQNKSSKNILILKFNQIQFFHKVIMWGHQTLFTISFLYIHTNWQKKISLEIPFVRQRKSSTTLLYHQGTNYFPSNVVSHVKTWCLYLFQHYFLLVSKNSSDSHDFEFSQKETKSGKTNNTSTNKFRKKNLLSSLYFNSYSREKFQFWRSRQKKDKFFRWQNLFFLQVHVIKLKESLN